jgi:hypothetical protein
MKQFNWYNIFLHLILVSFAIVIVLLIKKNQGLEAKLSADMIKKGDVINNIVAYNLEGNNEEIKLNNEKETILFIFSTTCPYCVKNIAIWKEMFNDNSIKNKYEIIGIACDSLSKVKDYVIKNSVPYKTFIPVNKDFRKIYKISGVPATVFIKNNKVIDSKIGLLSEKISY